MNSIRAFVHKPKFVEASRSGQWFALFNGKVIDVKPQTIRFKFNTNAEPENCYLVVGAAAKAYKEIAGNKRAKLYVPERFLDFNVVTRIIKERIKKT